MALSYCLGWKDFKKLFKKFEIILQLILLVNKDASVWDIQVK